MERVRKWEATLAAGGPGRWWGPGIYSLVSHGAGAPAGE